MARVNLDIDLLRSFALIAEIGNFTRASEQIGRTQAAVSLQIKRLEDMLGHKLFRRDGRSVSLTYEGEMMLHYAHQMLRLNDEAVTRLIQPEIEGRVRLGVPEDFASYHLAPVLADFTDNYPRVALEVQCDFTANLMPQFEKGRLDLMLFKQPAGTASDARAVWLESLVWAAAPRIVESLPDPLPLVLWPQPDVYRAAALDALKNAHRASYVAYESPSLASIQAAVRAGLGISVLPTEMVPGDCVILGGESMLPEIPETEITLKRRADSTEATHRLADFITQRLDMAAQAA